MDDQVTPVNLGGNRDDAANEEKLFDVEARRGIPTYPTYHVTHPLTHPLNTLYYSSTWRRAEVGVPPIHPITHPSTHPLNALWM